MKYLLIIFSFLSLTVHAQGPNTTVSKVPYSGGQENLITTLPDDYNSTTKNYPAIIFLNGSGQGGTSASNLYNSQDGGPAYFVAHNQWPTSFINPADGQTYKFIVFSPQYPTACSAGCANSAADLQNYIIPYLKNNYRIDPSRIYLTGISTGGKGVADYSGAVGITPTFPIAAIVPMSIADNVSPETGVGQAAARSGIHGWGFGNVAGDVYGSTTQNYISGMNSVTSGIGRFTNYNQTNSSGSGHCCWVNFYNPLYKETIGGKNMSIYEWMLQYTASGVTVPLSASAGSDKTITLPTSSVSISGSGTPASGHTITSYQWTKISGPNTPAFSAATSAATTVSNLVQGTYVLQLTVTQDDNSTATDQMQITVNPAPPPGGGKKYTITPPTGGHLIISGGYNPGDTLILKGKFLSIYLHLQGTQSDSIYVAPDPVVGCDVGDTTWNGGSYAEAFDIDNCKYISLGNFFGSNDRTKFRVWGTFSTVQANRIAYFDIRCANFSERMNIHNLTVNGGGTGIWFKTEVRSDNYLTWQPYSKLGNFIIDNVEIVNTGVEGMYLGHTADFWDITYNPPAGKPFYPSSPTDFTGANDTATYKLPIKFSKITVRNSWVHWIGSDGIQTSNSDTVEIYNNIVEQWATGHSVTDEAGILIGNRIGYSRIHDNIVRNTDFGQFLQFYGEGGGSHVVQNNLFHGTPNDEAIYIRPVGGPYERSTAGASVQLINNTIAYSNAHGIRSNGYFDASPTANVSTLNLFISIPTQLYYNENGGALTVSSGTSGDKSYSATSTALVDTTYYQPLAGSPIGANGYRTSSTYIAPPTASAGVDKTIQLPTSSVALSGSGTPASGQTITYQWSYVSGPTSYSISSPSSPNTNVNGVVQGTYVFRLTVTQSDGQKATDDMTLTVKAANIAPTANAGSNQTITLPTNSVTLSGSGTDADGTIASHIWGKVSGPTAYTITSPTAYTTTVTGLTEGTYVFRLSVTDDQGATATSDVTIIVNPAPNVLPTANAGNDKTITLPVNSVSLSGSGTDQDGTITAYKWTFVNGPSTYSFSAPNASGTTVNNLSAGIYTFRLTVTDNVGGTASDDVQITVNPNPVPQVNAGSDQTITLPTNSVMLSGSATDDGTIVSYQWAQITGPSQATITSSTSASTTVTNLIQGAYQFMLTATDNGGASGSDEVVVVVYPASGQRYYILVVPYLRKVQFKQ